MLGSAFAIPKVPVADPEIHGRFTVAMTVCGPALLGALALPPS
jgi:hypothetical protein